METEEIREKKEPKRLPVWACILLFALGLFVCMGLYGTIGFGLLSLILGDEARHPGLLVYTVTEASMLLSVLTPAVILLYFERRPFSDLGLTLKGHVRGLWYGLLVAMLLYLIGFGLSLAIGEVEVTGFQFDPLNLLGTFVFCLLVALTEEIMMRGYILGRLLHTRMNKFLAVCIAAYLQPECGFSADAEPGACGYVDRCFLFIYTESLFPHFPPSFLELDSRPDIGISSKWK